jgi:hypothetical protein
MMREVFVTLTFVTFGLAGCERGPTPADTIRNLYTWYVEASKKGGDPFAQQRTEMKQFVTERLLTSVDTLRQGVAGDPLADAEDLVRDLKLSIEKVKTSGGTATARVLLTSRLIGQHTLNLYLLKEDGRWKVDDVKLVEPPV